MNLKNHVFFKTVGTYGQVHIPAAMREALNVRGEEFYAMIVIVPVVTKSSSMNKEEAYEFLRLLTTQSERTPAPGDVRPNSGLDSHKSLVKN